MSTPRLLSPYLVTPYPSSLHDLPRPPAQLWSSGPLPRGPRLAIVGTRTACEEALAFTRHLAAVATRAGLVVVSGGALGVDGAAHRGALEAGGATLCVVPCGPDGVTPPAHEGLFLDIARGPGCLLWPFEVGVRPGPPEFFQRNGVLVALSRALVLIQAGVRSGALNATGWARRLGRPVYVVGAPPWAQWRESFAGNLRELQRGGRLLTSAEELVARLTGREAGRGRELPPLPSPPLLPGIAPERPLPPRRRPRRLQASGRALPPSPPPLEDPCEIRVFAAADGEPRHVDEFVVRTGDPTAAVTRALLTLSLGYVLVEGPSGFFRRNFP